MNQPSYLTSHTHIRYWEPWNEPDSTSFWVGSYAQLVRLTEDARCIITGTGIIHNAGGLGISEPCMATAIDSTALIVMPSYHAPNPALGYAQDFLYCSDTTHKTTCNTGSAGAAAVDVINFHMKPGAALESTMSGWVSSIRGILQSAELAKPLFNDEGGFFATGWSGSYTDADMQASYIARYYLYSAYLNIPMTVWYDWNSNGLGGTAPSPTANTAYTQVYNWMVNSNFSTCSVSGTIWTCSLTLSNGVAAQAMWDTSQSCLSTNSPPCTSGNVTVSGAWLTYLDLTGTSHAVLGNSVPVGIQPILLRQE